MASNRCGASTRRDSAASEIDSKPSGAVPSGMLVALSAELSAR
ncbi:hypothetical protein [Kitasatospora sp. NBC_01266]|nr:hypothetical protein [Kitasatospora sp. NBC_01266]